MNDFTASNGFLIIDRPIGFQILDSKGNDTLRDYSHLSEMDMEALEEYFRFKEDARLNRWRDPENPVFYVYSGGAWDGVFSPIRIVAETNGASWVLDREDHEPSVPQTVLAVARRFFDAHPEPKPWHDAKPGELWVIRLGEEDEIGVSVEAFDPGADVFQVPGGESISITRSDITAGRCIWSGVQS